MMHGHEKSDSAIVATGPSVPYWDRVGRRADNARANHGLVGVAGTGLDACHALIVCSM